MGHYTSTLLTKAFLNNLRGIQIRSATIHAPILFSGGAGFVNTLLEGFYAQPRMAAR